MLTRDGKYLIAGSEEDNKVFIWDLQTRQVVDSWEAHKGAVLLARQVLSSVLKRVLTASAIMD